MRIAYVTLCLAVIAAALVAVGASSAGGSAVAAAAKCDPGAVRRGGVVWVQYCGPGRATARFSGRTVRFTSGRCITRKNVKSLFLGAHPLRGFSPKTKYWELVTQVGRDGVVRKNVFVEWWLGKTHYVLVPPIKMTFRASRTRGTYTGKLQSEVPTKPGVFRNLGTASGSFTC